MGYYCLVGMWLGAAFLRGNKHVGRLEYGRVGCQLRYELSGTYVWAVWSSVLRGDRCAVFFMLLRSICCVVAGVSLVGDLGS